MILLWGLPQDPNIRTVRRRLDERGAPTFFLNHGEIYATEVSMTTEPHLSFELISGDRSCRLEDVSAAYLRPYDYRRYPPSEFHQIHPSDPVMVHHLIAAWAEYTCAPVIGRPSTVATAQSYLYQADAIRASGFRTPNMLLTSDAAAARRFDSRHRNTVTRTLAYSQNHLIAAELTSSVLLREQLSGEPVRVHLVAEKCFSPMALPGHVERSAFDLTHRLGAEAAGLTLIPDTEGPWYCLGVDPNPAFASDPLADAVANAIARVLVEAPDPVAAGKKTARPPLNGAGPMGRNYAVLKEETV